MSLSVWAGTKGVEKVCQVGYTPRLWAQKFHDSFKRFAALILHRRCGKTTAVVNHHQRAALDDEWERARLHRIDPTLTASQIESIVHPPGGRHYAHILPLRNQAKITIWDAFKFYASTIPGVEPNESELLIRYPNGNKVQLFGADNPDAFRGPRFNGVSLDEFSQHPPNIYGEIISKGLADSLGYCVWLGTIKGEDQLYQLHQNAKRSPDWFTLWQDVDVSLATEDDATIKALVRAMADDRMNIELGIMTQADYDQEWFLRPEAAIKGAWFGEEMAKAKALGHIATVPFDPRYPVDTDWDLGVDDQTAIWFSQTTPANVVNLIDYYANTDQGLPFYINVLHDKRTAFGYVYGEHWGPHDINARDFGTGKSRKTQAAHLGVRFKVVPKLSLADGISAVRQLLPRCRFDETHCKVGLQALRQYRRAWNAVMGQFTGEPVHNQHSHGADAFRGLAVRHKAPDTKPEAPDEFGAHSNLISVAPGGHADASLGWMS